MAAVADDVVACVAVRAAGLLRGDGGEKFGIDAVPAGGAGDLGAKATPCGGEPGGDRIDAHGSASIPRRWRLTRPDAGSRMAKSVAAPPWLAGPHAAVDSLYGSFAQNRHQRAPCGRPPAHGGRRRGADRAIRRDRLSGAGSRAAANCATPTGCSRSRAASMRGLHGQCDACLEDVDCTIHVEVDERLDPSHGRDDDPFGESNVLTGRAPGRRGFGAADGPQRPADGTALRAGVPGSLPGLRGEPKYGRMLVRARDACETENHVANLKWKTPRSKTRSRRAANWKLGDVTTVLMPAVPSAQASAFRVSELRHV